VVAAIIGHDGKILADSRAQRGFVVFRSDTARPWPCRRLGCTAHGSNGQKIGASDLSNRPPKKGEISPHGDSVVTQTKRA